jgi:hypothetical protein
VEDITKNAFVESATFFLKLDHGKHSNKED